MNYQTVISRTTPKTRRPVEKRVYFISSSLKKKPIELKKTKKFTLGRSSRNSLRINEGTVSERHASIKWDKSSFKITDLRSTNGTFVNGRRISGTAALKSGDKIRLGKFVLSFTGKKIREKAAPAPKKKARKAKRKTARKGKGVVRRSQARRRTVRHKAPRRSFHRSQNAVTRIRF